MMLIIPTANMMCLLLILACFQSQFVAAEHNNLFDAALSEEWCLERGFDSSNLDMTECRTCCGAHEVNSEPATSTDTDEELDALNIFLKIICPLLGCIIANFMFAAPVKDVRKAVARGTLGVLNPTPWAVMTGNCLGWVTYSYLRPMEYGESQFIFWANAPGLIISIWLNLAATKLQYSDYLAASMRSSFVQLLDSNRSLFALPEGKSAVKGTTFDLEGLSASFVELLDLPGRESEVEGETLDQEEVAVEEGGSSDNGPPRKAQTFAHLRRMSMEVVAQKKAIPSPHEKVVVGVVSIWLAVISLLSFLSVSPDRWEFVVGIVVNINLSFFYGAPLSTIFEVLKTRDSSSIHRWTMLMNMANACFWTAFGFGNMDWILIVPNGLGAILGVIQILLRLVVPSREVFASSGKNKQLVESSSGERKVDV